MELGNLIALYKACLFFGLGFSILTLVCGGLFDDALDGVLDALLPGNMESTFSLLVTFLSIFGGMGLLFAHNTLWANKVIFVMALLAAILLTSAFYFLYLKPMKESENSVAFSVNDLVGRKGELTVSVSKDKYGEVVVRIGASYTNQIAASISGEEIAAGSEVLVKYIKDGVLYISQITNEED